MADQEVLDINFGVTVTTPFLNQEIANLLDFLDDMLRQLTACDSAHQRNWLEPDLVITRHNLDRVKDQIAGYVANPQLYLPNVSRDGLNVAAPPTIKQPENQGALILSRHLARFRQQLRNGNSGTQMSGFQPVELKWSIQPMLDKADVYLSAEEARFAGDQADYLPEVDDQQPNETTEGEPDNY